MDYHQMLFTMAVFLFGVGFQFYFVRLMTEWPLFGRWVRYCYGLGTAYDYGLKEIVVIVPLALIINIGGIYFFIRSLEYFIQIESILAMLFCLVCYLYLPSLLFNFIRSLLQILPISDQDFVRAAEHPEFKTGLRSDTNKRIMLDIKEKNYKSRFWRVSFSILILALFYGLPYFLFRTGM